MAISDVMHPQITESSESPDSSSGPPAGQAGLSMNTDEHLEPGTRVEVRNRLDGRWAKGFEVLGADPSGYRLRRLSDGNELPLVFSDDDVRREKRRNGMWWY
jgi:hypothetical protein